MKSNLAIRVLVACAAQPGTRLRKSDIAAASGASPAHLALVIHQLGQAGFLTTRRGRGGGIALARDADGITVGEVYRRFEPADRAFECKLHNQCVCPQSVACGLTGLMCRATAAFFAVLDTTTLAELARGTPVPCAAGDLYPI